MEVVERCLARAAKQKSTWLFSTHGKAQLYPVTVTELSADITTQLLAKPEAQRVVQTPFQLRDIRRTCETSLARMQIPKDVRGQIQSHGLGGIQDRHYDKHDYMLVKRDALDAWSAHLETPPVSNVIQLRGAAA